MERPLRDFRDRSVKWLSVKLLSKHPQRAKFAAPNPEKLDSFFVTDIDLYKAIMSFPNGSAAGPDKIVPQIFKDLVSKSNGSAGLNFLKSLTKLINLIGNGKIPEPLRPFFWRKAYRPHKDRRRVETDCHRQHAETCRVWMRWKQGPLPATKFFRKRTGRMRYQTRSRNSCALVSKPNWTRQQSKMHCSFKTRF